MERLYLGLTLGVPRAARIETLYGRDARSRLKFSSRVKEGKRAITRVEVRERLAGRASGLDRVSTRDGAHPSDPRAPLRAGKDAAHRRRPLRQSAGRRRPRTDRRGARQASASRGGARLPSPGDGRAAAFRVAAAERFRAGARSAASVVAAVAYVATPERRRRVGWGLAEFTSAGRGGACRPEEKD